MNFDNYGDSTLKKFESFTKHENAQLIIKPTPPELKSVEVKIKDVSGVLGPLAEAASDEIFTEKVLAHLEKMASSAVKKPKSGDKAVDRTAKAIFKELQKTDKPKPENESLTQFLSNVHSEHIRKSLAAKQPGTTKNDENLPSNSLFFINQNGTYIDKTQTGVEPNRETSAAVQFTFRVLHAAVLFKQFGKHDPQTPESSKVAAEEFLKLHPAVDIKVLEKLRNDYMDHYKLMILALVISRNESGGDVHEQMKRFIELYPPLKRDIAKMKPEDMFKISRASINKLSKTTLLEKSVTIRKTDAGYEILTRVHSRTPGPDPQKPSPDAARKYIAKGGQTVIKRVETSDKKTEVLRKYVNMRMDPNAKIKRDKTISALKAANVPHVHIPLARASGSGSELGNLLKAEEGEISTFYPEGDLASKMDFNAGKNKSKKSLPPPVVLKVIDNLTETLSMMHSMGIAHLDLKPENILVGSDDFKLHDFETNVHTDNPTPSDPSGSKNETNNMLSLQGTLGYMAPELIANAYQMTDESLASASIPLRVRFQLEKELSILNEKNDIEELRKKAREIYLKADSYSLAVLIHVLMMGKMPLFAWKHSLRFNPLTEANSTLKIIWGSEDGIKKELEEFIKATEANYDPKLLKLVVRGLSPNPAERPNMQEFRKLFEKKENA